MKYVDSNNNVGLQEGNRMILVLLHIFVLGTGHENDLL